MEGLGTKLSTGLNLQELINGGTIIEIDSPGMGLADRDPDSDFDEDDEEIQSALMEHANLECVAADEDTYADGLPFQLLADKMQKLTDDGKVKKRILVEGTGELPQECAQVTVHYNGYIEHKDIPFDSTYVRKRPHRFILNDGRIIPGLDLGIQSMKLGEKSQFLIHPDYAYKNMIIGRIPPNATVLFEVELLKIVNSGGLITYNQLSEEQKQDFGEIYKYASALCEAGKDNFSKRVFPDAIKNYNFAGNALKKAEPRSDSEMEEKRNFLVKIYKNLLISYTHNGDYRKAILNAYSLYSLTLNGDLMEVEAKVHYNHAKCLRMLCEYDEALIQINRAIKKAPKNEEIASEMLMLQRDIEAKKKKDYKMAKSLIG